MRVVFRVDASREIGTGHVMRCLTLARAMSSLATIEFICREQVGDLCQAIDACGFRVYRLPAIPLAETAQKTSATRLTTVELERDLAETIATITTAGRSRPEWLIVDHYGIDAAWETAMRPHVHQIFVIDDLADRAHDCDVLLDQNYYVDAARRYSSQISARARCLLGPQFALLRPEFAASRDVEHGRSLAERLFVSFGGHDRHRVSMLVVEALRLLGRAAPAADVVSGMDVTLRDSLSQLTADLPNVGVHGNVSEMACLMSRCTFAVGAGGSSTWERCVLGLPTLVVVVADNQRYMTQDLADIGAIINLGDVKNVTVETLANAVSNLRADKLLRQSMRAVAMALVDGQGTLRVVREVTGAESCFT